jgi:hypothetical protein
MANAAAIRQCGIILALVHLFITTDVSWPESI